MQEITFEKLDGLEAEFNDAGEAVRAASAKSDDGFAPTDLVMKLVHASLAVNCEKDALKERFRHEVMIAEVGDPKKKARIEALLAENAVDVQEQLKEFHRTGDTDDTEDLAWDFHLAQSPKESYLRYQLSKPIVSITSLPEELLSLVEEARRSYAMEQELSVIALGRVILECAMNDIGERTGLFSPNDDEQNPYWDYPPSKRANSLFGYGSPRWRRFKQLYRQGSEVIHVNRCTEKPEPLTFLNGVLQFVSDEYAVHSSMISKKR